MIDALDRSLETFLRRAVPIGPSIDVVFRAPDSEWAAQRSRPTVALFLHTINPAQSRASSGLRNNRVNGDVVRERDLPLMALQYVVSVWVSDPTDEHRLLGEVMRAIGSTVDLPVVDRDPALPFPTGTIAMSLVGEKERPRFENWGSLGVSPRASLDVTVYLPAGAPERLETAEPPETVDVETADRRQPSRSVRRRQVAGRIDPSNAGRRVVGRRGSAVVQESGRFVIPADDLDEVRLASDADPEGEPIVPFEEDSGVERPDNG